jgi:hypothetical protein
LYDHPSAQMRVAAIPRDAAQRGSRSQRRPAISTTNC